jgi:hypothetical protein
VSAVRKAFEFLARARRTCFCEDAKRTGFCEEEKRGRKSMCSSEMFFMVMWREICVSLWMQFGFCVFSLVWPLRRKRLLGFVACARLARVASQRATL